MKLALLVSILGLLAVATAIDVRVVDFNTFKPVIKLPTDFVVDKGLIKFNGRVITLPTSFAFNKQFSTASLALDAILPIAAYPLQAFKSYVSSLQLDIPAIDADKRFSIFQNNSAAILRINKAQGQWWGGINQWSFLTWQEFASQQLKAIPETDAIANPPRAIAGKEPTNEVLRRPGNVLIDLSPNGLTVLGGRDININTNLPDFSIGGRKLTQVRALRGIAGGRQLLQSSPSRTSWSWKSIMPPVRNQGQCGSCWSFAAIGSIEALYRIKRGVTLDLSEEQVVDCCDIWRLYWSWACDGGYTSEALRYAKNNGLAKETSYPYKVSDSDSCNSYTTSGGATAGGGGDAIRDYYKIASKNYAALANSVVVNPTTISFKVVDSFQHYSGGVYSSGSCGGSTNHAMIAVGYQTAATASTPAHWIIRNSWGSWWGEGGYIRVSMIKSTNSNGMCGMYTNMHRPTL